MSTFTFYMENILRSFCFVSGCTKSFCERFFHQLKISFTNHMQFFCHLNYKTSQAYSLKITTFKLSEVFASLPLYHSLTSSTFWCWLKILFWNFMLKKNQKYLKDYLVSFKKKILKFWIIFFFQHFKTIV
jgi:hypothetical protein